RGIRRAFGVLQGCAWLALGISESRTRFAVLRFTLVAVAECSGHGVGKIVRPRACSPTVPGASARSFHRATAEIAARAALFFLGSARVFGIAGHFRGDVLALLRAVPAALGGLILPALMVH